MDNEISLTLTLEELGVIEKLISAEDEKYLNRLERNIDVEENNINKINMLRVLNGKIQKVLEDYIEELTEGNEEGTSECTMNLEDLSDENKGILEGK